MQPLPPIPEALLQALEQRFPDQCPDLVKLPEKEALARFGELRVIRFLRTQFEEQTRVVIRKNP